MGREGPPHGRWTGCGQPRAPPSAPRTGQHQDDGDGQESQEDVSTPQGGGPSGHSGIVTPGVDGTNPVDAPLGGTFDRPPRSKDKGPGLHTPVTRVALPPPDSRILFAHRGGAHRPAARIPETERVFVMRRI
jgi:hypothetical protein